MATADAQQHKPSSRRSSRRNQPSPPDNEFIPNNMTETAVTTVDGHRPHHHHHRTHSNAEKSKTKSRPTKQLDFDQAMADFKTMFPTMDCEIIEAVLRANDGAVDSTIDQLLTMSIDTEGRESPIEIPPDLISTMETCQICYKTYKDQPSLRRHTRYAHGSEFVQCQYCEYEVPANVKHRLKFHEERRHGIKKTSQKVTKKKIKSVANKVTPVEPKTSTVSHFQMTPVRSPTPVYVDMPTFNLTPDEEMLFLGRPLQTGSPVELLSLLDRPRPNHTVPSPLTAPNTTTAPVRVPDVSVQPAAVQTIPQTTPLPVTINPNSFMQAYFTATPLPAAVQATSHSHQPLPVTSTTIPQIQPYFTATPQPAAVQTSSQTTQPLPVTISTSSLWQPYLAETVAPQSTPQLAQQVPVPTNPSTMERNDKTTSDHSKISEAPSSPPPMVEGYDPEMPWIDGDKRRVEFREEIEFYPPRRIQMTATGRGRLYDWSHLGVPTQETLNDPRFQLCSPPSSYLSGEDAELIRRLRSRARTADIDARVVPDGYLGLLKEEKAVLPDGTVYVLKSTWIPDPSVRRRRNTATQTEEDTCNNQVEAIIENREIRDNGVQATVTTEDTSTQCNILQELLFSL